MGKHKPVKLEENEAGELVKVRYPDDRSIRCWEDQRSGRTLEEIAKRQGISITQVNRDLKLYRDTLDQECDVDAMREELYTLRAEALANVRQGFRRGSGMVGLRFFEGMGALNQKIDIRPQDTSPTPEQFKKLGEYARDNPAIGLILLQAMGIQPAPGPQGPSDKGQGILSQGDGGTPGSGTEG